jgi:DNA polymerase-3 subunit gamma/tau
MTDGLRPATDVTPSLAGDGGADAAAAWPPPVPSILPLRPRSAAAPALDPGTGPGRVPGPGPSAAPAPAASPVPPAAAPAQAAVAGAQPPATLDAPLLDPAGFRIRLVRDAAAVLTLAVGAVLAGSLLGGAGRDGAVLSATGGPGAPAGDPRGAPGMALPAVSRGPDAASPPAGDVAGSSPSATPALDASAAPVP